MPPMPDNICNCCNRKVGEFIRCVKCGDIFHPSCLLKSANRKNATCHHAPSDEGQLKLNEEISIRNENKTLRIEIEYLKSLLDETRSKNTILLENNELLKFKISSLELQIKTTEKTVKNTNPQDKTIVPVNTGSSTSKNPYSSVVKNNLANTHDQLTLSSECQRQDEMNVNNEIIEVPPVNIANNRGNSVSRVNLPEEKTEWTTVEKKRRKPAVINKKKVCFGTKTDSSESLIQGAIRRKWIYVGRIAGKEVTEQDMLSFLDCIEGSDLIIVKKLNTIGQNSAFSIGLPDENAYKTVFCESFWPRGVILREFSFDKNFFQKNREQQKT
ncbi:uncharacterized protein LOC123313565 [Coccinella septempunctata]|uniref:uncharacterized protein LOC123313565 n=1 Tax=Coccinella septempunctata TaxID=41139 RepID=UPI001D08588E|nr:uncharacterized protein LOC123313565 [Coccinella septempunctata]XP_044754440.1 uncharacterized protein LOC123313565 [Coccinella septempunctata]